MLARNQIDYLRETAEGANRTKDEFLATAVDVPKPRGECHRDVQRSCRLTLRRTWVARSSVLAPANSVCAASSRF